jgi:hypothetical protein
VELLLADLIYYIFAMDQEEFNSLAIFVAVVEELRREPFFSEDNHDKLSGNNAATFCHPMFLKSAVLPFRKIWMSSERCAFRKDNGEGIRELVFREHPDKRLLGGYRYWFYENYEKELGTSFGYGWATESKKEIIDLWLNTQLAHTGPMNFSHKPKPKPKQEPKKKQFSLADFNACGERIGREKFEFLFRSSVATIGHTYISFAETLVLPLFKKLRDEQKMEPSFEAEVALKYNPYPDPKYGIRFDDVFWHLNRETVEDSFCRLLARQRFSGLRDLLRALFNKVGEAIECVGKSETFDGLLKEAKVVILKKHPESGARFIGRFNANSYPELGRRVRTGSFVALADRRILFSDAAQSVLSDVYIEFRAALNEARQQQRQPQKW